MVLVEALEDDVALLLTGEGGQIGGRGRGRCRGGRVGEVCAGGGGGGRGGRESRGLEAAGRRAGGQCNETESLKVVGIACDTISVVQAVSSAYAQACHAAWHQGGYMKVRYD
jgi:hypothetical protein